MHRVPLQGGENVQRINITNAHIAHITTQRARRLHPFLPDLLDKEQLTEYSKKNHLIAEGEPCPSRPLHVEEPRLLYPFIPDQANILQPWLDMYFWVR
jgi:hypothetical protein